MSERFQKRMQCLIDLFFLTNETDFASYVDDNTPYVTFDSIEDIINWLENDSIKLFKWFAGNHMKVRKDKCHLLISGGQNITINVDGNIIEKSICEKLLGVNIDYKLKFNEHDSILKKACRKENALSRILHESGKKTHIKKRHNSTTAL